MSALTTLPHTEQAKQRSNFAIGLGTLRALLARDVAVTRRSLGSLILRAVMQPLAFTFGFAYVIPAIGGGGLGGGAGQPGFSTVLVPGLVAITIAVQGITSVLMPMLMEMTYTKQIEDRALAPVPLWVIGLQKVISSSVQTLLAAAVVFPVVLLVHRSGAKPEVHVHNWPLFLVVLVFSCLLAASFGLLLGTLFEITKVQNLIAVVITPMTVLGCVYFPWASLDALPWLQYAILLNPVMYISEALRACLTPGVPHLPVWACLLALIGGTALAGGFGLRQFGRRVTG
ncbi:ABC transporter permease [Streptomyces sp. SID8379]|uniref:ABC transporter permease n=1 Tax=unclassified Streptomyces TaxID=2593676 RepID=UPI0003716B1B|nr:MULTISPECIES: ABC transporter permease [unclassified Streptomyces]MYW65835.1 ABC transporter permease [Streptomyces sp. SID8379]